MEKTKRMPSAASQSRGRAREEKQQQGPCRRDRRDVSSIQDSCREGPTPRLGMPSRSPHGAQGIPAALGPGRFTNPKALGVHTARGAQRPPCPVLQTTHETLREAPCPGAALWFGGGREALSGTGAAASGRGRRGEPRKGRGGPRGLRKHHQWPREEQAARPFGTQRPKRPGGLTRTTLSF